MTLADLRHPNVMQFLGACMKLPHLAMVTEHMPFSLHHVLYQVRGRGAGSGGRQEGDRWQGTGAGAVREQRGAGRGRDGSGVLQGEENGRDAHT